MIANQETMIMFFGILLPENSALNILEMPTITGYNISVGALLTGIVAIVGVIVTYITFYYQKKYQRLSSIMEAFRLLNDDVHRKAREATYNMYRAYNKGELDAYDRVDVKDQIAMVRADFDQMGSLVRNNLIPRDEFLSAYWHTILLCWKALEHNIEEQCSLRQNPKYMENFRSLKAEATVYWHKHHPQVREIIIH